MIDRLGTKPYFFNSLRMSFSEDRRQFALLTGQWNFLDVSHSCLAVAPALLACRTSGREE